MPRLALCSLLAALLAAGAVAGAEELYVLAAASLSDALEDVARPWKRQTGHAVVFNFGASSDLARQVRAGAPADVLLSADEAQMDGLEKDGFVRAGDRVDLLSNSLVVVVPVDSAARPAGPADLLVFRKIALADPEAVPAGVYARAWLEGQGLWARLRERIVPALNVRAALAAVESGNADAGVVYKTDAAGSKRARVAFEVPRSEGPAIVYPLAPLAGSTKAATAAFVKHLRSAAALEVFVRHGFVGLESGR
jgi:molybdate transport system substrate-binding protein